MDRNTNFSLNQDGPLVNQGAVDLQEVDLSSEDYEPTSMFRGFHVNTAGNVSFQTESDRDVIITVLAGVYYPYHGKKIYQADTTATLHAIF